jgi:hypothetical protein
MKKTDVLNDIESFLDNFDLKKRNHAIGELTGKIPSAASGTDVNLHCHTFFSYNAYGYSPSKYAYLAKKTGLAVAGIVDFDVLDGADEFLQAAGQLGLKACVGMESRVFVPEFAKKVINSPGEPGISYHMGIGFTGCTLSPRLKEFQQKLFKTAQQRNRELIGRVNAYLDRAAINYEKDVLPLTPAGNATERHICLAYAQKARQVFTADNELATFWSQKLGVDAAGLDLPDGPKTLNSIRAKTMKRGGVGYVQPDGGSFPTMAQMNEFVLAAGAIPVITWLDGTSEGEQSMEELADIAMATGAAALNIIPDRNYKPGVKDDKLANLYAVVELANHRGLPVVVGTEMNSPGNKFVDSFGTDELKPLVPVFLKGAHIIYAHTMLQKCAGLGYLSNWAKANFKSVENKNVFYEKVGKKLDPAASAALSGIDKNSEPAAILEKLKSL